MGIFELFNEMELSSKPDFYSYFHLIYVGIDMGIGHWWTDNLRFRKQTKIYYLKST